MKVKVESSACIGCGACQAIAPDVFEINDEGFAEVVKQPTNDNIDDVKDALSGCPTTAISEIDE